jgi:hypothetical protein
MLDARLTGQVAAVLCDLWRSICRMRYYQHIAFTQIVEGNLELGAVAMGAGGFLTKILSQPISRSASALLQRVPQSVGQLGCHFGFSV